VDVLLQHVAVPDASSRVSGSNQDNEQVINLKQAYDFLRRVAPRQPGAQSLHGCSLARAPAYVYVIAHVCVFVTTSVGPKTLLFLPTPNRAHKHAGKCGLSCLPLLAYSPEKAAQPASFSAEAPRIVDVDLQPLIDFLKSCDGSLKSPQMQQWLADNGMHAEPCSPNGV
jgi:hypothetical protein